LTRAVILGSMASLTQAEAFIRSTGFALGESPYLVKGTAYVYHAEFVRTRLPGGEAAQRAALGAVAEHPFWGLPKAPNDHYDLLPLVACGYACADVTGMSMESFVALRSRHQAEHDLTTLRRVLLSILTPKMVANRFPFLVQSYFNFGTAAAEAMASGVRLSMSDLPRFLEPWIRSMCFGFMEFALESAGAKDVAKTSSYVPADRHVDGVEVGSLHIEMVWL